MNKRRRFAAVLLLGVILVVLTAGAGCAAEPEGTGAAMARDRVSSGRICEEEYDSSGSVLLHSTLYYETQILDGTLYQKLIKVEMKYERKDPSVSVCSTQIRLGCVDTAHQEQIYETDIYMEEGRLYTIRVPDTWEAVNTCRDWTMIGGNLTLALQRGGSRWQAVLKNIVANQG